MGNRHSSDLSRFVMAGINYRKTDSVIRSLFAVNDDQYHNILQQARSYGIEECFVLSTCNRTEIYGITGDPGNLVNLVCAQTEGSEAHFRQNAYIKQGQDALDHLFGVAAGLDSQILGDYEIVGQLKHAAKLARDAQMLGAFADRLISMVFQCSKHIKANTQLSKGTVSVSFAAVQYLKDCVADIRAKKITLIGTGKFGRNTCKNIVDYLQTSNITLINRTEERAVQLAQELGVHSAPFSALEQTLTASDIILVATNAPKPIIYRTHLEGHGPKILIDLSIPCNIDKEAGSLPGITLIDIDTLSKLKDETLAMRKAEVPKAKAIIAEHLALFDTWLQKHRNMSVLKALKTQLREIHASPLWMPLFSAECMPVNADEKIQRVINGMVLKMREQYQPGCCYLEAINEFISTSTPN